MNEDQLINVCCALACGYRREQIQTIESDATGVVILGNDLDIENAVYYNALELPEDVFKILQEKPGLTITHNGKHWQAEFKGVSVENVNPGRAVGVLCQILWRDHNSGGLH